VAFAWLLGVFALDLLDKAQRGHFGREVSHKYLDF
jgi:hypothetical protein